METPNYRIRISKYLIAELVFRNFVLELFLFFELKYFYTKMSKIQFFKANIIPKVFLTIIYPKSSAAI